MASSNSTEEHETEEIIPESSYFTLQQPEKQEVARKTEQAHTLQALPILEDLLARLDARIAFYERLDSIPEDIRLDPEKFIRVYNANELTRKNLQQERNWITDLIEVHTSRR